MIAGQAVKKQVLFAITHQSASGLCLVVCNRGAISRSDAAIGIPNPWCQMFKFVKIPLLFPMTDFIIRVSSKLSL